MTQLRGDFAVLMMVSLPDSTTFQTLNGLLQPIIQKFNLAVTMRELKPEEIQNLSASSVLPYTLMVYGLDHPGIVYRVAQTATEQKINITDLRTHVTENNTAPLYSLILEMEIPNPAALLSFQKSLENLKEELHVDMTLKPVEADEL